MNPVDLPRIPGPRIFRLLCFLQKVLHATLGSEDQSGNEARRKKQKSCVFESTSLIAAAEKFMMVFGLGGEESCQETQDRNYQKKLVEEE